MADEQIKMTSVSCRLTDHEKAALAIVAKEESFEFGGDMLREIIFQSEYGSAITDKAKKLAKNERRNAHSSGQLVTTEAK